MKKNINWTNLLNKEKQKFYFKKLINKINTDIISGKIIYPKKQNIFYVFKVTNFKNLKVVILGQDPYHEKNQANGLAFSVMPNIKIPASLKNIYKSLKFDIPNFKIPKHGYLLNWAKQGVMLLNTVLTVEKGLANSHNNIGWEKFTNNVINIISNNSKNIVFLLWGKKAKKKIKFINNKKHYILYTSHPSPYSAHKGFLYCKHFSKTNKYLIDHKYDPIDWNLNFI
ncbi:uracil-DNA glycosylase [Enterobacteriaceae endosymbiont of Plateumaris braccata]|uniref:uracil-DNA glycosylase n=1 Tax=Enterobacteriaceae endosymbiont of Plateumaris braccata TaxID=2675793 RepID=UPI001449EBD6|nr:uracil-DNA glycosylase [Enterobacteriaceae endosymbiont of Plateumaris braccata]QJC28289.1 uracil-DNA glycosylase [Enterobacteriaceae endosymbiont of Plateumaris braccata]